MSESSICPLRRKWERLIGAPRALRKPRPKAADFLVCKIYFWRKRTLSKAVWESESVTDLPTDRSRSRGFFMLDCRRNNGTCKSNHDDNLIQFDNFLLKLILYAATRASRVNNRKNTAEEKVEKKSIVTKVIAGFLTLFSWKNILSKGFLELVKD